MNTECALEFTYLYNNIFCKTLKVEHVQSHGTFLCLWTVDLSAGLYYYTRIGGGINSLYFVIFFDNNIFVEVHNPSINIHV